MTSQSGITYRDELVAVEDAEEEPLSDKGEDGELEASWDVFRGAHGDGALLEIYSDSYDSESVQLTIS